ncbi:MAG: BamA/TamA family outer membrane protein [Spirochaeta sp.]
MISRHAAAPSLRILWVVSIICIAVGCATITEDDELLYTGGTVTLSAQEEGTVPRRQEVQEDLQQALQPRPNTAILGLMRPGLWVYRITGDPEEPGLRRWFADQFAETPVLYNDEIPERGVRELQSRMFNRGFFDTDVEYTVERTQRTAHVEYTVEAAPPYIINRVRFPDGDSELHRALREAEPGTLIQEDSRYRLEILRSERIRLDRYLKDQGFFGFNPGLLIFDAEVDYEKRLVDLDLAVEASSAAAQRYRIAEISIYADYSTDRSLTENPTAELGDNITYYERHPRFDPQRILDALLFRPGDTYHRRSHVDSLNRLMSMDAFRFVNIRYQQNPEDGTLHAQVLLSPAASRSLEGEIRAVTHDDGFAGPGISASWVNRNLMKGAERLRIEMNGAVETQLTTELFSLDAYELELESMLTYPRIAGPLNLLWMLDFQRESGRLPHTFLRAGVRRRDTRGENTLDQAAVGLGYEWGDTLRREFWPIEATAVRVAELQDDFLAGLGNDPDRLLDYQDQLLLSTSYQLRYSKREENSIGSYALAQLEASADVFDWTPFFRVNTEARLFFPLGGGSELSVRGAFGAGRVLTEEKSIPVVRQFRIGGGNSLRGFQPQTLGPGTVPPGAAADSDRSGELLLEGSLEYRFGLIGYFHGAIFADAGNIWMLSGEQGRADAARLLPEMAVSTGVGLRLDAQVVVLRFDVGMPVRKPWLPSAERWTIGEIDPGNADWRRDNLVFTLAIGYPF